MTEQQNTRPSASREIAVKPLEWSDWTIGSHLLTWCRAHLMRTATTPLGIFRLCRREDGEYGLPAGWFIDGLEEKLGTHKHDLAATGAFWEYYQGLVLSAIDTTSGNTDPIAKYDDELRKAQGGWRDMDDPALEQIKKDGEPIIVWAKWDWDDMEGENCGEEYAAQVCCWVPDARYNLQSEDDEGAFLSRTFNPYTDYAVHPIGWSPLPTEHPTEQPSVKVAENGEVCKSPIRSKNHNGEEVVSFDERHTLADIARWISENPVDRDEMVHLLTGGQMKQPSVRDAARVLLRQWDEHGEGIQGELVTHSLVDDGLVPDIDGTWVEIQDVTAALRSLAQEGEG